MNPWDKTTAVETAVEEEKLSSRGYFWFGCVMGVVWTLEIVATLRFIYKLIV